MTASDPRPGLDQDVHDLATTGRNFAALSTLDAAGAPRTHVMWIDADDSHLLLNTEVHRQKYRDVARDPRVTVTIWLAEDPYRYVEVRGVVDGEVGGDAARRHIDVLSRRYTGRDYATPIVSERVILRVAPTRVYKKVGIGMPTPTDADGRASGS
jgi:PPOX class probable F420-dependent enzyme